jgi:uncharacterized protein YndB with AHSA1/START domain
LTAGDDSGTGVMSDYHCTSRWELEASREEVFDLLVDVASFPRWWPSSVLDARTLDPGDERAVGRTVEVLLAAFLPATLRIRVRLAAVRPGERIAVETTGDLDGMGLWALEPGDRRTIVRSTWRGRLRKPVAGQIPTFLRPTFMASHRWAMERGFTGLLLEVWRRRATDQAARDWLPRPPGPVFPHNARRWWIARRTRPPGEIAASPTQRPVDLP